eukprot:192953-Rhodomonas_salina.2
MGEGERARTGSVFSSMAECSTFFIAIGVFLNLFANQQLEETEQDTRHLTARTWHTSRTCKADFETLQSREQHFSSPQAEFSGPSFTHNGTDSAYGADLPPYPHSARCYPPKGAISCPERRMHRARAEADYGTERVAGSVPVHSGGREHEVDALGREARLVERYACSQSTAREHTGRTLAPHGDSTCPKALWALGRARRVRRERGCISTGQGIHGEIKDKHACVVRSAVGKRLISRSRVRPVAAIVTPSKRSIMHGSEPIPVWTSNPGERTCDVSPEQ